MSTIHVAPKPTGDDVAGDGSFSKPYQTIHHASQVAAAGDTIQIAAGTYHETDAINSGATAAIVPQVDAVTYFGEELGSSIAIFEPTLWRFSDSRRTSRHSSSSMANLTLVLAKVRDAPYQNGIKLYR